MKTKVVAKPSAIMGLIEAAHCGQGDWQAWSERLLGAASSLLQAPMLISIIRREASSFSLMGAASAQPAMKSYWLSRAAELDVNQFDVIWRYPFHVGLTSQMRGEREVPEESARFYDKFSVNEVLCLVALVDNVSVSLAAPLASKPRLSAVDRQLLKQAVLHVESALRLRIYPGTEVALLRPDGELLNVEGQLRATASERAQLARHVAAVERGRARKARKEAASVQAWSALISGGWGLIEREDAGIGRCYAVVETSRTRHLRALSELETHAVELSARGLPGKTVGYALGISSTRVSKLLASAALKLGLRQRTHLVQLVAGMLGSGPHLADETALSRSERDVLALVRLGFSNAKIASERGRSERTIANQVASILRKLRAPSRRALAVARAP